MQALDKAAEKYEQDGLLATLTAGPLFAVKQSIELQKHNHTRAKLLHKAAKSYREDGCSIRQCITAVKYGWSPKYWAILGLTTDNMHDYVTRDTTKYPYPTRHVNQNAWRVLNDKLAIYSIFDNISDHFANIYGTIHDGVYISEDDGATTSLIEAVDKYEVVAAKPADKWQGLGFHKIAKDGSRYTINEEEVTREGIIRLQEQFEFANYIVMEYLTQADYSETIYPRTVNTVRFWTVRDPDTAEISVIRPVHRFGTDKSYPVDNFDNGGVLAPIDKNTGELRPMVLLQNGKRVRSDVHPETRSQVTGIQIPMWDQIKDIALEGASAYPNARIIGWDFVVTEEKPIILETSGQPSSIIPQIESGLLEEPIVRQLFEESELFSQSSKGT